MARVKVIALWADRKPDWFSKFMERVEANRDFMAFEIVDLDLDRINALATKVSGVSVDKRLMGSNRLGRPMCDLRPLFGLMFREQLKHHEWWGWSDLDVVYGDLGKLWGPLLDSHDAITASAHRMNGALSILRNDEQTNNAWRKIENIELLLQDQNWKSIEEAHFHPALQKAGCRIYFDSRETTDYEHRWKDDKRTGLKHGQVIWHVESSRCRLDGRNLIEVPDKTPPERGVVLSEREIALYHFCGKKKWPM